MSAVQLNAFEVLPAAYAGAMRQVENLKLRRKDAYGAKVEMGFQNHIQGAQGEMVVAKLLNRYWSGKGFFRGADVGTTEEKIQVRTRDGRHGCLLLHPDDPDDAVFYLVLGINGVFDVAGWITGAEGKNPAWWDDKSGEGRPCFFVPRERLHQGRHTDTERAA